MTKWFKFMDMHSGGYTKTKFDSYFVEASDADAAVTRFKAATGEDPDEVACQCCGSNFAYFEVDAPESSLKFKVIPLEDAPPVKSKLTDLTSLL